MYSVYHELMEVHINDFIYIFVVFGLYHMYSVIQMTDITLRESDEHTLCLNLIVFGSHKNITLQVNHPVFCVYVVYIFQNSFLILIISHD